MRPTRFQRTIEDISIELDGYSWQSCTFKNCEIILSKGDCDVVGCTFDNCRLTLLDKALGIAKIIALFSQGKPIKFIEKG